MPQKAAQRAIRAAGHLNATALAVPSFARSAPRHFQAQRSGPSERPRWGRGRRTQPSTRGRHLAGRGCPEHYAWLDYVPAESNPADCSSRPEEAEKQREVEAASLTAQFDFAPAQPRLPAS
eukprot:5262991-Pyramimonas_sp.AAC.1